MDLNWQTFKAKQNKDTRFCVAINNALLFGTKWEHLSAWFHEVSPEFLAHTVTFAFRFVSDIKSSTTAASLTPEYCLQ